MDRRTFMRCTAAAMAGCSLCGWPAGPAFAHQDKAEPLTGTVPPKTGSQAEIFVREAMFYEKKEDGVVECRLCPRQCEVENGSRGYCGVRENRDGKYQTLVYGRAVALNNDPIEKKPLNHVYPGTTILSVATAGCNLACKFCQNWQISQFRPEEVDALYLTPEKMVDVALKKYIPGIAFTYNEPTVCYEYMHETVRLARENSLHSVAISNGFISPEAVTKLAPLLTAYKVDLKSFDPKFYQEYCSANLKPVLNTLETLVGLGTWVEIVNLVLPTANDREKDIRAMAKWIKETLGDTVPIHFTRFHPMYKIRNLPPTPVSTLKNCHQIAKAEGLKYVYIGNVPGMPEGNTYCHNCGQLLVERVGLWSVDNHMKDGKCPSCQTRIPGVF